MDSRLNKLMPGYEEQVRRELRGWQRKMTKRPTLFDRLAKNIQTKANNIIPDKAHEIMTAAIKNMVKAVLSGSEYTTREPLQHKSLEQRDSMVKEKIVWYKRTAGLEGAGTGAGGILWSLADFPLLLSIKMKFLFEAASLYGYNVKDIRERLFILHLFQLAFSSRQKRATVYRLIANWDEYICDNAPTLESIDWRVFQQEYRDYIDLAKLLQMIPGVGAVFGAYANYKLLDELGVTAMNGYRLRFLNDVNVNKSMYIE